MRVFSLFRKLVKPLYKRRNSGFDDSFEDDDNFSFSLSRRGSHLSCQSNTSKAKSKEVETEENSESKEEIQHKWRKVLSISRAIGR